MCGSACQHFYFYGFTDRLFLSEIINFLSMDSPPNKCKISLILRSCVTPGGSFQSVKIQVIGIFWDGIFDLVFFFW